MTIPMLIELLLRVAASVMSVTMIITLVMKVVAMAMGIVSLVLGFFPKETSAKTQIILLCIGLTALAIAALL